ncbi:site-specific integrase [Nocardia sp. CC201C]|uniref:tyrosine-type recombinase/integrase n=1 Tax=Nocardia sp. CC201C TaxID=3044575 RepID=UPI0024A87FF9|nr:site-specific integrase [Nocardia sp. CC201C]
MASIRTRTSRGGNTTYQLQYRLNGKQPSVEFTDYADAVKWQKIFNERGPEVALEMMRIADSNDDVPSLKQACDDYNDSRTNISDGTRQRYERYLRNDLGPFFNADLPVDRITDETVTRWINHLAREKKNSAKTIANKHGYLCGLMKWLCKKGHIEKNPCLETRLPDIDQAEMTFLESDEVAALLAALPQQWRLLVKFLVVSGVRWGEVTALQVGDVNRKDGTVRIRRAWKYTGGARVLGTPKTKKSRRTINLAPDLIDELPLRGRPYKAWLFTNSHGDPVQISTFYKSVWVPTLDKLAADPDDPLHGKTPRIHDLRHTCASWMIAACVPLPVIQSHLGHESITTTVDRYGHLDRQAGAAAAAAMAAMLAPPTEPAPAGQVVALRRGTAA